MNGYHFISHGGRNAGRSNSYFIEAEQFIRDIAVNWCEAKSPIYQKYVGDFAVGLGDVFEFMCLHPDLFVRWTQAFYKTGSTATEAAKQTLSILNEEDEN